MAKLRIGLLIGNGGRVPALRSFELSGHAKFATVCAVTCKREEPPHLTWLRDQGVPSYVLNWPTLKRPVERGGHGLTDAECNQRLGDVLEAHGVDWVITPGWIPQFSPEFIHRFGGRVVNVHPGLIPWSGLGDTVELEDGRTVPACRGKDAVAVAMELKTPVAGCIIHFTTPDYDSGPVIWRHTVEVRPNDTYETLAARIHAWEDVGLPQVVQWIAEGRVRTEQGRPVIEPAE